MTDDAPSPLVPKLRFPEFYNDAPWLAPPLTDLYAFKRTNTLSRENLNYDHGTIRNIHYGDIHTKFAPIFRLADERVPYVNLDAAPSEFDSSAFCEEGDIVMADASEDLEAVGKAIEIVSLDGERVVAGTHTILATRRGDVPVVGFGGQLFRADAVRAAIKKEAQGAKVYGISMSRISGIRVPVPPTKAEQQLIAECLGSLDDLIAAEERKLEALRRHKLGLMQELLPRIDESEPRRRFIEYQGDSEWRHKQISELVEKVELPIVVDPTLSYRELGVRSHGKGVFHKAPKFGSALGDKRVFQVVENALIFNIVFAWERAVATTSSAEAGMIASHRFPMYLPKSGQCDVRFMKYAFLTQRGAHLLHVASPGGAGRNRTLGQTQLMGLKMAVPGRAEQGAIADVIDSADRIIEEQARRCRLVRQHQDGLIQQMFPDLKAV